MEMLGDVLVSILLLLDWASLLRARRVCKKWKSVIRSPEFRAGWQNKGAQDTLLAISAYNFNWEQHPRPQQLLVWSPSEPTSTPVSLPAWMKIPLAPATFDIVASSHGLIAARHPSWSDRHTPGVEFTVGNPVTNEWVRIPRLKHQKWAGRLYSMAVDPSSGDFGLLDWNNGRIYESSSRSWSRLEVGDPCDPEVLDLDRRGLVRLKEPLAIGEFSTIGCAGFVWEHGGKHYVARTSELDKDEDDILHKVWSLQEGGDDEGGDRVYESREVASSVVDASSEVVHVDQSIVFECQAEGNLVCFTGQCRDFYDAHRPVSLHYARDGEEPVPAVVYDLERRRWCQVPASKGLHHRRAVVYRASLVKPSGCSSSAELPQFGDGEFVWHKRRREEQPEMGYIREKRMRALPPDMEMWEDIFYL